MKSLKHSRAVKVCSPDIFWQLFSFCVFCFQLLGFEVDSINSVQFSNHTGQATDLACVSLSSCVPALCGCVWVSQFPRCRDEVLASVNRHGSLRGSDRAEADDSTDKWVSVEVSGCMLRHQNSLETQISLQGDERHSHFIQAPSLSLSYWTWCCWSGAISILFKKNHLKIPFHEKFIFILLWDFFNMSRENLKLLNWLSSKTVLFFYILKLISCMLRG